ncbi:O-antigen ligase family protein [Flavobacteriaceae bacterium XHP0103]|uniref:O-antigen ligase family protein n=1 Tax=Marixanthotalea marina TaxID=2844359 RepID=UPI002989F51F|nr:O-antigen ligase family protein [Marixanthotalea marina]MBU3820662.1 O-antigen ligase family protein [Marixanthotalea marina]
MINPFLKFNTSIILLALVSLFPILKINYNSYTILCLFVFCLYNGLKTKKNRIKILKRFKKYRKPLLVSVLTFFLLALSLIYTNDINTGLKSLQHILALLIFPVVCFLFIERINDDELGFLLSVFVLACLFQLIYIHFNFFNQGLYKNLREAKFYDLPFRVSILSLKYQPLHPTYISIWYSLSIAILLKKIPKNINTFNKKLKFLSFIILISAFIFTIIILSSRAGIVSLIIVFATYFIVFFSKKTRFILFMFFLTTLLLLFKNISFVSARFIEEFKKTELLPPEGKRHNSINIRVGIYKCAVKIIKENPLLGVGVGDTQDKLDSCYESYNTDAYSLKTYNSHNYYFHIVLSCGLIGFVFFIYSFVFFFKIVYSNNSFVYLSLLLMMITVMFFENFLSRNHGVIFFSLMNTLFIKFLYDKDSVNRCNCTVQ